jgi:hypothetical protein
MLLTLLKLILGVVLVVIPAVLVFKATHRVAAAFKGRKFGKALSIVVICVIVEVIGLHLIIDPIVPGQQAAIHVHAFTKESNDALLTKNFLIELAPLSFDGKVDYGRLRSGTFSHAGIFSTIMSFDWGEHRLFIRIYDRSQSERPVIEDYKSISPYVRVGLFEKHIYLDDYR